MVHLKIVLDTRRKKSDGTYPVTFRITNVKKVHLIQAEVFVNENDWDKSQLNIKATHPNYSNLNVRLSKRYYEIQKAILQLEELGPFCFEALKGKLTPQKPKPAVDISFITFANKVVDEFLLIKRTGNALVYKTAINRLMDFAKNPKLEFKDIDFNFLSAFQSKLLQDGMSKNTIGNYFRSIRALYNRAIKAKIVARDSYPFHDISIKTEKTAKRAINNTDLIKIYSYPKKEESQLWHASNFFFLSFSLRGMSFTDMAYLTKSNLSDGYITYRRRKTKKLYTIKLHPIAMRILSAYPDNDTGYFLPVFPNGIVEDSELATKITRQWIKVTNKYLNRIASMCELSVNLTTYVTRHTWATTAKKLGYSNEMIAEALGHEYGNKITNIYLDDFDQTLIDQMNDRVIMKVIPCIQQIRSKYRYTLRPPINLKTYIFEKGVLNTQPLIKLSYFF